MEQKKEIQFPEAEQTRESDPKLMFNSYQAKEPELTNQHEEDESSIAFEDMEKIQARSVSVENVQDALQQRLDGNSNIEKSRQDTEIIKVNPRDLTSTTMNKSKKQFKFDMDDESENTQMQVDHNGMNGLASSVDKRSSYDSNQIQRVHQIDDLSSAEGSVMCKGGGMDMISSGTYAQILKKGFN